MNASTDGQATAGSDITPVSPWRMAEALIKVMQVVAKPPRYLRLGKALIQEGVTPDDLMTWYGKDGRWWKEDWRGKAGHPPSETGIRQTVKTYLAAGRSGGNQAPTSARRSNIASAVEAAIARMNAHGQ